MADKKNKIKTIIIIVAIVCIILIPFILAFLSSYSVLIKDIDSKYYKAKTILIYGDFLICMKDSSLYDDEKKAAENIKVNYTPAFISMKTIAQIKIILNPEDMNEDSITDVKYLGTYVINASGHIGYLYLYAKDNKAYGTVRFPKWANGVYEPLKGLKISKGKIQFTRSVTTLKEMRRVGANTYFTQFYVGDYNQTGSMLKGLYLRDGAKYLWEANRVKQ